MFKSIIIIFIIVLFSNFAKGQQFEFSKEIKFAKYLISNEQQSEALTVLNQIDTSNLNQSQKDSLFFEIGWLCYSIKKLDSSILCFNRVSPMDNRHQQTIFFSSYSQSFLKQFAQSKQLLSKTEKDTSLSKLKNFELAGIALLERNKKDFEFYSSRFTFSDFYLKQEEQNLVAYSNKIFFRKKKSPFIAGTLSAILPGAGKWYAGKKRQALGAFLPILSSAILTIEAYNKGGLKDARFWLYGSFFTTFYIGNIWGSTLAVKVKNKEFNELYDNKVLFDMHIPLRSFFN